MDGCDSVGPGLQLVGTRFSNFLLGKLLREFKLRGMSMSRISNGHISVVREATVTWSGTLLVLHTRCMSISP